MDRKAVYGFFWWTRIPHARGTNTRAKTPHFGVLRLKHKDYIVGSRSLAFLLSNAATNTSVLGPGADKQVSCKELVF